MRNKKPSQNRDGLKRLGIFSWSIIGSLVIAALFFYIIYLIRIAVVPVLIAVAIAYLVSPLMMLLQRKMRKGFALAITYIIFVGVIGLLFFFIIPIIVDQFRVFIDRFPSYLQNFNYTLEDFFRNSIIVEYAEGLTGKEIAAPDMNSIYQYFMGRFDLGNINILEQATAFTRSLINIILYLIIGPLLGIYILKDIDKLREVFIKVFPGKYKNHVVNTIDRINHVAGRYIRGQIFISIIIGVLCTIVLLVLKVDFAVLLGAIAGIFNLIPLLGPIIGGIPAALAALFISPLKAILVILLFIAVQQIDNYIISPNVMKFQVGVHPGIIIFSLMAGGALFGFWGLLIAVPTVAIIQETLKYYLLEKKRITSR
jgi:predicted PurR-regulated permease PerM